MWSKTFTAVKYTLVTVNFLLLLTGIIVLTVGWSVQSAYDGYHEFLSEMFFLLPAFCIATGFIIFLISFAGFYGALTEKYYMNMAFAGAMVLIFVFQLSACIAGFALWSTAVVLIQDKLRGTMDMYPKNIEVTMLWDEVQRDFQCCGVTNASDWLIPLNTTTTGAGVPVSCCQKIYGTIAHFNCTTVNAYTTGCGEAFGAGAKGHIGGIAAVGVFLVLIQALVVSGAVWVAKISSHLSSLK